MAEFELKTLPYFYSSRSNLEIHLDLSQFSPGSAANVALDGFIASVAGTCPFFTDRGAEKVVLRPSDLTLFSQGVEEGPFGYQFIFLSLTPQPPEEVKEVFRAFSTFGNKFIQERPEFFEGGEPILSFQTFPIIFLPRNFEDKGDAFFQKILARYLRRSFVSAEYPSWLDSFMAFPGTDGIIFTEAAFQNHFFAGREKQQFLQSLVYHEIGYLVALMSKVISQLTLGITREGLVDNLSERFNPGRPAPQALFQIANLRQAREEGKTYELSAIDEDHFPFKGCLIENQILKFLAFIWLITSERNGFPPVSFPQDWKLTTEEMRSLRAQTVQAKKELSQAYRAYIRGQQPRPSLVFGLEKYFPSADARAFQATFPAFIDSYLEKMPSQI